MPSSAFHTSPQSSPRPTRARPFTNYPTASARNYQSDLASPFHSSGNRHHKHSDVEEDEYDLVKTYESNHSLLPTHSPSNSFPNSPQTSISTPPYSMDTPLQQQSRFAAGGFNPYSSPPPSQSHGLGEDKVAEKANSSHYGSSLRMGHNTRYAKLIPEQKPPQSPVSTSSCTCNLLILSSADGDCGRNI